MNIMNTTLHSLAGDFRNVKIGSSIIVFADCFEWLDTIPENSLHSIVTDPPYGLLEYNPDQLRKRKEGRGGVWRIPPAYDGIKRSPLPRFTALNKRARATLSLFFEAWAAKVLHPLRPGGHVFVACNSFLSQLVFSALVNGGLEYRTTIIRLVGTLRGGDRPKNAEKEFSGVCSLPRGCWEPWGLFRKPIPRKMTVSDCLRTFSTGGLRRKSEVDPFKDVIHSERTPKAEKTIANHPSLKPQSFLRQIVHASLPLGEGIVADPFMGSGSTIAAAEAIGYRAVGVEHNREYFESAAEAIKELSQF